MKKILTAIIALCAATAVTDAQENIRADYDFTSLQLRTDSMATTRFTLVSGPGRSLFFNTMSLYVDSLTSTPEGKKRLNEIQWAAWKVDQPDGSFKLDLTRQAPRKTVRMYVEKDFGNSELKFYNRFGEDDGYYAEPFDELKWEIQTDSTATVLGYECFMATTHYHGREWKGWFAPEIPVQDGPWKLQGLPGLILKAEADNGTVITATGIQATGEAVPPMYQTDTYARMERQKALGDEEHFRNNFQSTLAAQGVRISNKDGSPYTAPKFERERHALETDY